jgi:hypothetical protein
MNKPMETIPLDQCVNGGFYRVCSRNLSFGVFIQKSQGFVGIREKFGNEYLFIEYHCDTEIFGTVYPRELLETCPIDDLREVLPHPDNENMVIVNKPLFEWLKERDQS